MKRFSVLLLAALVGSTASAEEAIISLHVLDESGRGMEIGTVNVKDTEYGALFTPNLTGLTPGLHGFHVHENPDCGPAEKDGKMVPGLAAGGHYDPGETGQHIGPYAEGHLGDLPALYVDSDGNASHPVLAPRVKVSDLESRSLVIHAGGDNYSDNPALGGGGARAACGVVPSMG